MSCRLCLVCGRVKEEIGVYFNELGFGEGGFEIKFGEVYRPEESIGRDNKVEENIHTGKRNRDDRRRRCPAPAGRSTSVS
jgi:hypothetical protein